MKYLKIGKKSYVISVSMATMSSVIPTFYLKKQFLIVQ